MTSSCVYNSPYGLCRPCRRPPAPVRGCSIHMLGHRCRPASTQSNRAQGSCRNLRRLNRSVLHSFPQLQRSDKRSIPADTRSDRSTSGRLRLKLHRYCFHAVDGFQACAKSQNSTGRALHHQGTQPCGFPRVFEGAGIDGEGRGPINRPGRLMFDDVSPPRALRGRWKQGEGPASWRELAVDNQKRRKEARQRVQRAFCWSGTTGQLSCWPQGRRIPV